MLVERAKMLLAVVQTSLDGRVTNGGCSCCDALPGPAESYQA